MQFFPHPALGYLEFLVLQCCLWNPLSSIVISEIPSPAV